MRTTLILAVAALLGPGAAMARLWHYNLEALHFLYGGLLSAYVILYFKSSSGSRTVLFFIFLAVLTGGEEAGKPANSRRVKERLARGGYPTRSWEV